MSKKLFLLFIMTGLLGGIILPSYGLLAQIIVEDVDGNGSVQVYEDIFEAAQLPEIPERITLEYAETMYVRELTPSNELISAVNNIQAFVTT
jgi:hypothetical protein